MDLTLTKPELLDAEAWKAVEQHRGRLQTAIAMSDAPFIIGSAKELVECVARVAASVKGVVTPSNADFAKVVNDAHLALDRQAGPDITRAADIRAISDNAKKIVLSVKDVRTTSEPATVTLRSEASPMRWSRWWSPERSCGCAGH